MGWTYQKEDRNPLRSTSAKARALSWPGIAPSVKPEARQDAAFGMELSQWSSNVNFTQHFRLKGNGQAKIDLAIVYMACNDENCMPPKTETFSVKVPAYKP